MDGDLSFWVGSTIKRLNGVKIALYDFQLQIVAKKR